MSKKVPQSTLTPLTEEQIKELALGIFRNEIFTDRHIDPQDAPSMLRSVFMPLGFLGRKEILHMQRKQRPGLFYARMDKAGPRSINGYPMFFELSMASEEDAAKVWEEYSRLDKAVED
jgi:hypothetical protein